MNYEKLIEAMVRDMSYQYHFTNYEFEQVLNIKCPRPENSASLKEDYFNLMNNFIAFLKNDPDKKMIESFILKSINNLVPSKYLIEEFELLILKYNGISHFFIGIDTAKEYFDFKKDELIFAKMN